MRFTHLLSAIVALAVTAPVVSAQAAADKVLVNVDKRGLALEGYDPVAFFTDGKPVKGTTAYTTRYHGAEYHFASEAHRVLFAADPAKYAPQFGGYCAYGVSRGHAVPVEIDTWQLIDGRLVLNYDQGVKKKFDADRAGNLRLADEKWPGIVEKEGKGE
jgi:YHS domain-containing protein